MRINDVIEANHLSKYRIAKNSGIPYMTLNDICNGKTDLANCSARTVYKLAKELNITMEELLTPCMEERPSFDIFKSNTCHRLKTMGDIEFLLKVLEEDEILFYYNKKWYPECLYMLAMVDYLSRIHNVPLCSKYDELRKMKLEKTAFPSSIIVAALVSKNDTIKEEAIKASIPEFIQFNIVEKDIRDVQ